MRLLFVCHLSRERGISRRLLFVPPPIVALFFSIRLIEEEFLVRVFKAVWWPI